VLLLGALAALVAAFVAIALARIRPSRRASADRDSRVASDPSLPATQGAPVTTQPAPVPAGHGDDPAEPLVVADATPTADAAATAQTLPIPNPARIAETLAITNAAPIAERGFAPTTASRLAPHEAVIGYVSVPPDDGPDEVGASERAIERVCERCGWRLVDVARDPDGASLIEREALSGALERIADGEASALVVNDAWALCRSVDVAELLERLDAAGAALVAIDLGLDTSTAQGRRVARALMNLNGWGRRPSTRAVVGETAEVRRSDGWAGRLSLDRPEPRTPAHPDAGHVVLNGPGARARTGTGAIALNGNGGGHNGNGATARNGTIAIAPNGNGNGSAHNGNGAAHNGNGSAHNGNGAAHNGNGGGHNGNGAARNGTIAIALNGNGNGNGNGSAHNGNGAAHNGNGAAARKGTLAIALNGNGATARRGDDNAGGSGNGRPRDDRPAAHVAQHDEGARADHDPPSHGPRPARRTD